MTFRKLISLSFLLLPFILLSSCGSNEKQADPQPVPAKCLLTEYKIDSARWYNYFYDANALTIKADWRSGLRLYTSSYVYNAANQLVELTQVQTNGNNYFYITYTYNSSGRWQTMLTYTKQNNVLTLSRTVTYTYSPTGQLIRRDEDIHYPASSSSYTTYTYTNNVITANSYTASGALYWIEEYEFDNNKTATADVTSSIYGNEFWVPHNIIRYTLSVPNGGVDFQRSYTASFSFNADGYPVQRVERDPNGDVRTTETYTYNCQ